jgi:arsenite/tail-anchored protein-transporting ATPase
VSAERASSRSAFDELLDRLPRVTLVVGKGGVGKTTCAIGVAASLAERHEPALIVSTDPANSLGPMVGMSLEAGEARAVDGTLSALQLDPAAARRDFLARWRDILVTIVDRGTYLDAEDIGGLVDAAFPGADEIFGLLVLARLVEEDQRRLVVDTAPTGHTLRLLGLAETFQAVLDLLESMQGKHRFMVNALTHRYRRDAADEFLETMRRTVGGLRHSLGDATRTGAVLVTRAEAVVVRETERYAAALRRLGITISALVVEAFPPKRDRDANAALEELRGLGIEDGMFVVPAMEPPPEGIAGARSSLGGMVFLGGKREVAAGKGLRRARRASVELKPGGAPRREPQFGAEAPQLDPLLRTLTIVGGKGGVGKTTVSCALALSIADDRTAPGHILLVSTDPAPSIGDALGVTEPRWAHDGPVVLDAVPRLHVWQMDATAAFLDLRDRYRDRIDELFDSFVGKSVDAAHDRAILRDLLALAPPGIDELYALASLGDALAEEQYTCIVVDPAPTGHLLRLLQLPALAIDWSHRLMRLIMKYKEIAGLGEAAEDLLNFTKRTRALDQLLRDQARAGVVLVSLNEPAVIAESIRLAEILRATGIGVLVEIRNRATSDTTTELRPGFLAPEFDRPLVGLNAIRDWTRHWRRVD